MPIFDFSCPACGAETERLVSANAPAPACPQCGAAMQRLMGAPQAPGKTRERLRAARAQAKSEGHFSHYSAAERARL